jgi:glycosyltransferase involved in cell wall biosynthesis
MKVLLTTNVPSPYMVSFLNELGRLCDLTVIFEKRTSTERNESWEHFKFVNFDGIILNGIQTQSDAAFCPQIAYYLKDKKYDHIIITNPATPTGVIAIVYMKIRKMPYILESEGGFAKKDGRKLKEKFKKYIISGAELYLSTTPKADEYFLTYGAPIDRIVKYPFTSLYENEILESPLSKAEKNELRRKLGLHGENVTIAVGRFVPLKAFDVLIDSWKAMDSNNTLCIIGEGSEKEKYLKLISKSKLTNIVLLDFMERSRLFMYYKAADLFIHPTTSDVWGLVVNEAMACGLPVITTDMCIAGLELVQDYENGFIVNSKDNDQIIKLVKYILEDEVIKSTMAKNNLEKIRSYTFETMAKRHISILKSIENKSRIS